MNGAVERLIRSVKQSLTVVLHGQVLTQETLTTSLAVVEATLNNLPLTIPSDDPQDLTAITPNSFLIQRSSSTSFFSLELGVSFIYSLVSAVTFKD